MMTGCVSSTSLVIPENLKVRCPDLQKLESGQSKEIIRVMIDDRRKYVDCQSRYDAILSIFDKSS